jgi:hypothetical protein
LGRGLKGFLIVPAASVLLFVVFAGSMAYAQSYSSSSDSSGTACCCCCLPVLIILVILWLNSRSKTQPQPAVVQATVTPQQPVQNPAQQPVQIVYKEKETIREIVKVRCEYCGTLIDVTSLKCPSCGAPLKR